MTIFQTDDARFAGWHYRRDPTHVVFYRESTLAFIANRIGWTMEIPRANVAIFRKPEPVQAKARVARVSEAHPGPIAEEAFGPGCALRAYPGYKTTQCLLQMWGLPCKRLNIGVATQPAWVYAIVAVNESRIEVTPR